MHPALSPGDETGEEFIDTVGGDYVKRGEEPPVRFSPGTMAVGAWAVVTGTLIAIWAVAAVVGVGTWFPWWLLVAIPWIWVMIRRARRRGE